MIDYSDTVARAAIDYRFGPAGNPPLSAEQRKRIDGMRETVRLTARHLVAECPPSIELDQALVALDASLMWAAHAISRNEHGIHE